MWNLIGYRRKLGCFLDTSDLKEIEMKKPQILLALILTCLLVASTAAQVSTQNGEIVEQNECWKDPYNAYEDYVAARKERYATETNAAKSQGFQADYMTDFAKRVMSKEDFEQ